uniref:Uncharacterized protein n=2 Tax=Bursaphelenchus xylophilus TaxID=6326 RepID=A0A1I7S0F2_BURXY
MLRRFSQLGSHTSANSDTKDTKVEVKVTEMGKRNDTTNTDFHQRWPHKLGKRSKPKKTEQPAKDENTMSNTGSE